MADSFWKTHARIALLDAIEHGKLREQVKTILLVAMNKKTNIARARASNDGAKTIAQAIALLTRRSERRIEEVLKQLHDNGFGTWEKCGTTFQVHPEHATKDTKRPKYNGVNMQPSKENEDIYERLQILFDIGVRTIRKKTTEDDDMTKAMLAEIKDLKEAVRELTCVIRVLAPKDIETQQKLEPYLRLVENESN